MIELKDSDDLFEGYHACAEVMREARTAQPALEIAADYTGATKTMSAALVIAAMDWNAQLFVTSAERRNIIRVDAGETTSRAPLVRTQIERFLKQQVPRALESFSYPATLGEIRRLLQRAELDTAQKRALQNRFRTSIVFVSVWTHGIASTTPTRGRISAG